MRFRFERLEVWQAARSLNGDVYRLSRHFPKEEQFGLTSQIRRASVSISSNIAEGSGRNSDKDFAHFLEQAYGSLMEVASQLYLAFDEKYLATNELDAVLDNGEKLAGQLAALNRSMGITDKKTNLPR